MQPSPRQTSVVSKVKLPEERLEYFFNERFEPHKEDRHSNLKDFSNLNWCSTEAPAHGTVQIVLSNRRTNRILCAEIPVKTYFLVTATRTNNQPCELTFGLSLS